MSTALIKGVAREGKGTAEFVSDQDDRQQTKVKVFFLNYWLYPSLGSFVLSTVLCTYILNYNYYLTINNYCYFGMNMKEWLIDY